MPLMIWNWAIFRTTSFGIPPCRHYATVVRTSWISPALRKLGCHQPGPGPFCSGPQSARKCPCPITVSWGLFFVEAAMSKLNLTLLSAFPPSQPPLLFVILARYEEGGSKCMTVFYVIIGCVFIFVLIVFLWSYTTLSPVSGISSLEIQGFS